MSDKNHQVNKNELSDSEYIKELEGFVCFLAECYEKAKDIYFDKHLETSSVANPNRRPLTDAENSEWQRFPIIPGAKIQNIVSNIAKSNKDRPKNVDGFIKRFML